MSRIKLAESASQAGATDEAIQEFARAADQLKVQGRNDEYVRVAERLLFHQPDNLAVARELAEAYIDKNNARLALAKLQACLKAEPRAPENVSLLARAFEQLDIPKAVSVLKELAEIHQELGRTAERDVAIRRALALEPARRASCWRPRADTASASPSGAAPPPHPGRCRRCARRCPAAAGVQPAAAAAAGRGRAFVAAERRRELGCARRPSQDVPRIIAESDVFVKYGLLDRAVDHLRRAFEIQPDFLPAREKLAAVLTQLGRRAEAAAELEYMAERWPTPIARRR